jgi:uncharacterized protein (TIGR02246 family)
MRGSTAAAEASARRLYEELLAAWNRRDAHGMGQLFAPEGEMVGFDGSQVSGAQVEEHLTPIFADHPTPPYVWKIRVVRALSDDVALLRAIAGMIPPGQKDLNPALNSVQALVAENLAGTGWQVALFQNTPAQYHGRPEAAEAHAEELREVLRGWEERRRQS